MESLLAEAKEKIAELQIDPTASKGDNVDYLVQFDDTDTSVLPSVGSDEMFSLCGVISDYNGQKWLIRYADLNHNGCYHIFRKSEDVPPYFTNRDRIFIRTVLPMMGSMVFGLGPQLLMKRILPKII